MYRPLRKELTETDEKCEFCPKKLTSLKAYVLQNINTGKVVYSGPSCAKKHIAEGFSLLGIPDLTKFTSTTGTREVGNVGGGSRGERGNDRRRRAIEYINLRENKLVGEFNCSYEVLRDYYNAFVEGELDDVAVNHICNIENNAPPLLKLAILQKCYNYLFWIDVAIAKLDESKLAFLKGIRRTVVAREGLSEKQFNGLNQWLGNVDGVPQLK